MHNIGGEVALFVTRGVAKYRLYINLTVTHAAPKEKHTRKQ